MEGHIGVLAASIGLCDDGPGLSNVRIAKKVAQISAEEKQYLYIAAQWEVTDALWEVDNISKDVDLDIPVQERGKYLSGDDLVAVAAPFFRRCGVKEVIIVTDWILWIKLFMLFKKEGFKVRLRGLSWIPTDRKSIQPWTRSHLAMFIYAVRQVLFGYEGKYLEPVNYAIRVANK